MRPAVVALVLLAAASLPAGVLLAQSGDEGAPSAEDEKAAKAAEDAALKLGQKVFNDPSLGTKDNCCATCHNNPKRPDLSLKGVTARFPRWDRNAGKVITLQQKFQQMQERNERAKKAIPLGDDRWNAVEVYLRSLK
jgi:cytochrome c